MLESILHVRIQRRDYFCAKRFPYRQPSLTTLTVLRYETEDLKINVYDSNGTLLKTILVIKWSSHQENIEQYYSMSV